MKSLDILLEDIKKQLLERDNDFNKKIQRLYEESAKQQYSKEVWQVRAKHFEERSNMLEKEINERDVIVERLADFITNKPKELPNFIQELEEMQIQCKEFLNGKR